MPSARRLSHADASQTTRLMNTGSGSQKAHNPTISGHILQYLSAPGIYMKRGVGMGNSSLDDLCNHHKIPKRRVDTASHDCLMYFYPGYLADSDHVARR